MAGAQRVRAPGTAPAPTASRRGRVSGGDRHRLRKLGHWPAGFHQTASVPEETARPTSDAIILNLPPYKDD